MFSSGFSLVLRCYTICEKLKLVIIKDCNVYINYINTYLLKFVKLCIK